jgi:hypothetical protein
MYRLKMFAAPGGFQAVRALCNLTPPVEETSALYAT